MYFNKRLKLHNLQMYVDIIFYFDMIQVCIWHIINVMNEDYLLDLLNTIRYLKVSKLKAVGSCIVSVFTIS